MSEPTPIRKRSVLQLIRNLVDEFKTQKDAAIHMGCTPETLSSVLAGRRRPTDSMLHAVGVHRTLVYFDSKVPAAYTDAQTPTG